MAMGQVDSVEQAARKKAPQPRARRTPLHWRTRSGRAARAMLSSLALLLLILSVLEILRITFVPSPGSVNFAHTNLHPFATIRLYLRDGTIQQKIFQIGGNLAIGVALGFLLPQITPYLRGLIRVEIVTIVFAVLVELVQHYFIAGSSLNTDDVILAAAGAALGYIPLGRMFGMRLYPDHLHWWQRMLARSVERRRGRGRGTRALVVKKKTPAS
jgi:VanZ like protein